VTVLYQGLSTYFTRYKEIHVLVDVLQQGHRPYVSNKIQVVVTVLLKGHRQYVDLHTSVVVIGGCAPVFRLE
jgi:hypothetical protein